MEFILKLFQPSSFHTIWFLLVNGKWGQLGNFHGCNDGRKLSQCGEKRTLPCSPAKYCGTGCSAPYDEYRLCHNCTGILFKLLQKIVGNVYQEWSLWNIYKSKTKNTGYRGTLNIFTCARKYIWHSALLKCQTYLNGVLLPPHPIPIFSNNP